MEMKRNGIRLQTKSFTMLSVSKLKEHRPTDTSNVIEASPVIMLTISYKVKKELGSQVRIIIISALLLVIVYLYCRGRAIATHLKWGFVMTNYTAQHDTGYNL